jgi:hypothetical protein
MRSLIKYTSIYLINFFLLSLAHGSKNHEKFKVLLITESNLFESNAEIVKLFRNSLSSRLADAKMGVILPSSITQNVQNKQNNKEDKTNNAYKNLTKNNKLTLASQIGSNAILSANLNSFTKTRADIPKFNRSVITFKLAASYQFISAIDGAAYAGDELILEKKIPLTSQVGISVTKNAILTELIEKMAAKISSRVQSSETVKKEVTTKFIEHKEEMVPNPLLSDIKSNNNTPIIISAKLKQMTIPEILVGKDGQFSLSGNELAVIPSDAEIEVNGVVVGMCSDKNEIKVPEGLSRLVIRRAGYSMDEKLINAYSGMKLSFVLEPTPEEYRIWQDQLRFLQEIKTGEYFNENQKKLAEGMFEFLRNSKYQVPKINLN